MTQHTNLLESVAPEIIRLAADAIVILDTEGNILDANPIAYERLGKQRNEFVGKNISQTHDPKFAHKFMKQLADIKQDGSARFESAHLMADATSMPIEINARLLELNGKKVILSFARDISLRKSIETSLQRRDAILEAITDIASHFVHNEPLQQSIPPLLQNLGYATDACRVYVFRKHYGENGNILISQTFEWTSDDITPQRDNPALQHLDLLEAGFTHLLSKMEACEPYVGLVRDQPSPEKEFLQTQDILSIAIVPIIVGDSWWGFIGFDNCIETHAWAEQEISTLQTAADMLGVAIQHRVDEEKLKDSEELYRMTFNHMQEVVYTVNSRGVVQKVSPSVKQLFGFEPDEVIGKTLRELKIFREEVLRDINIDMRQVLSGSSIPSRIREGRTKNGESCIVEGSASPMIKNGKVIGAVGTLHNINDRKMMEDKLRKLSQAIEQAGESVVITDINGTIEYVNPAFTYITGYSREEVIGKNPRILKSGIQDDHYYKQLWDTITHGNTFQKQLFDRRKDGSFYPALMSIAPIRDENGNITHFVGLQQDMTEMHGLERQLRQAQKMEALGTLVGGIAHDFNNMLAGITGNLFLARDMLKDRPDIDQRLATIETLSYRAADIIQQLLTFARKDKIEMKPFDLTSTLKEIYNLNKINIPENITIRTEFPKYELMGLGDAVQLQQVILNLLNNARDALEGRENPQITFRLEEYSATKAFLERHPESANHRFAHFWLKDNGRGIDQEQLELIFEPFFTTKEVGKGTGLGLAMSYGAIRSHGGFIEVNSVKGKGTTFHVYLPLQASIETKHNIHASAEVVRGNGETLLLVDDEQQIVDTLKEVLENVNYNVLIARNGIEAVNVYKRHQNKIDLVLMDAVMPQMGGIKASEEMRKLNHQVNIIFATGYDREQALKSQLKQHAAIITKPFQVGLLTQTIRDQLSGGLTPE